MENLTGYREEIYGILKASGKPMTVREIYKKMNQKCDYSTVYRAMDFFVKKHNVKHVSFCSSVKLYFLPEKSNAHFLHCTSCHKTIEIETCFVGDEQKKVSKDYDFKINEHLLYFMGVCSECRAI